MSVADLARRERARLCDLMLEVGPDAPTLCEGWTVLDLAAHLVVRENDLWAAPGILWGGPFRRALQQGMDRRRRQGLERLVARIRRGPSRLGRLLPAGAHLNEFFIHHEDVRRADGRRPRTERDLDEGLARLVRAGGRLLLRRVRGGVELVWNGGVLYRHGPVPRASLSGPPGEILLYLSGRREAARVEIDGHPPAVDSLRTADLGQ